MHVVGVFTEEIMHKATERRVVLICGIDIDNMCAVVEGDSCFCKGLLHMIEWSIAFPYIVFRNEDDVGFGQFPEVFSLVELACVHHAAVVARSPGIGALVIALHFDIEDAFTVSGNCIEAHTASEEVGDRSLRQYFFDAQLRIAKDDLQQKLHTGDVAVETAVEKSVVNQTQLLDDVTIDFLPLRRVKNRHVPLL